MIILKVYIDQVYFYNKKNLKKKNIFFINFTLIQEPKIYNFFKNKPNFLNFKVKKLIL